MVAETYENDEDRSITGLASAFAALATVLAAVGLFRIRIPGSSMA
jgi:hypothetical protein